MVATSRRPNHLQALRMSSMLTARWYRLREAMRPIGATVYEAEAIIRLLQQGNVSFVLMGTHGLAGWRSEPRSTRDVDVLIAKKDHAKAVRIIRAAYPQLEVVDQPNVVTRFVDRVRKEPVIDLMKPGQELYRLVFRHTHMVAKSYRIPDLEMALTCKFAAMKSPLRSLAKRYVDLGDFIDIVVFNGEMIDHAKLRRLANKVCAGGGAVITKLIDDVTAGRQVRLSDLE